MSFIQNPYRSSAAKRKSMPVPAFMPSRCDNPSARCRSVAATSTGNVTPPITTDALKASGDVAGVAVPVGSTPGKATLLAVGISGVEAAQPASSNATPIPKPRSPRNAAFVAGRLGAAVSDCCTPMFTAHVCQANGPADPAHGQGSVTPR